MKKRTKKTVQYITYKIIPILKQNGVMRSGIFGSVAKGEDKEESDIDILVDLPVDKTLLDLVGLKIQLEEVLKRKVDILTYASLSPLLEKKILKEQIPIYDQRS